MSLFQRSFNNVKERYREAVWLPKRTLAATLGMLVLYLAGSEVFQMGLLDKVAVARGEVWRLLTGHVVHCRWEHVFWDSVAFVILGGVIERYHPRHWGPSLIVSCLGVSAWLFVGEPGLSTYCGLSGALNGLLILAVFFRWRETRDNRILMVYGLTALKIAFEMISRQTIFTGLAGQAVPTAHAAGFGIGCVYLGGWRLIRRSKYRSTQPLIMAQHHRPAFRSSIPKGRTKDKG